MGENAATNPSAAGRDLEWLRKRAGKRLIRNAGPGLIEDSGELDKRVLENMRMQQQLQDLSAFLQTVIEEERRHLAREIHDELGQILTALKMELFWISGRLPKDRPELGERARSALGLIGDAIGTVQRITSTLRPKALTNLSLPAAIKAQSAEFSKRAGIPVEVKVPQKDVRVSERAGTALSCVFQEALTNVARHAGATSVCVHLASNKGRLNLTVKDNGRGIPEEKVSCARSLGLIGIRERMDCIGGSVSFRGGRNKGTTVSVTLPICKAGQD